MGGFLSKQPSFDPAKDVPDLKGKVMNYIRFKHGRLLSAIISSSPSFPSFRPVKEARIHNYL